MKFAISTQGSDFLKGMWLVDKDQVYKSTKKQQLNGNHKMEVNA